MIFKNLCLLVFWTTLALALEGLTHSYADRSNDLIIRVVVMNKSNWYDNWRIMKCLSYIYKHLHFDTKFTVPQPLAHGCLNLLANFANAKWCKNPENWLKPWHMGTILRELSESYLKWKSTRQGLDCYQKSLHSCALEGLGRPESPFSQLGRSQVITQLCPYRWPCMNDWYTWLLGDNLGEHFIAHFPRETLPI